jgi:hypothetical protein
MVRTLAPTLNMRGKTISTYVVYEVARRLADANEALDNDLYA